MEDDDAEASAYLIAHELIEQHGDDVDRFLQAKIDEVMGARDLVDRFRRMDPARSGKVRRFAADRRDSSVAF